MKIHKCTDQTNFEKENFGFIKVYFVIIKSEVVKSKSI